MRFLNILLAFLLTAGSLQSQIATCDIVDLTVNIGDCTSDSTFKLGLDFEVVNPTSDSFEVWTGNNQYLGVFALSDLPIGFNSFPTGNSNAGFVRVCIQGNQDCCEIRQFLIPNCNPAPVCEITDLVATAGPCNLDGTFPVAINFTVNGTTSTEFEVWSGSGQYLGAFPLNPLPLVIPNYSGNGGTTDDLKVCIKDNPNCCAGVLFDTPVCNTTPSDSCDIRNLRVRALDCSTDNSYALWINFSAPNTSSTTCSVLSGNGQPLGIFNVNQLPIIIPNFPWNGQSADAVTICFETPITPDQCCATREFNVPDCIGADCAIKELKAETGACSSDSTYKIAISFVAPGVDSFELYAGNGALMGVFAMNQLPLALDSFPGSGEDIDYLKVCIKDSVSHCCKILEFNAPRCRPDDCGTVNFRVTTGNCADDGTYSLTISFESIINTPIDSFAVYSAEGVLLGYFSPANLPLTIPNYPWNGAFYDAVKICVYYADTVCCSTREFLPPDCVSGPCDISNITVETGPCNNDGTYNLKLNFQAPNAVANTFNVWAGNGQNLGIFPLNQLPVEIPNFSASGNDNDVIKICINDAPDCCTTFEFPAPDCPPSPCEISNLTVLTGDCTSDSTYVVKIDFDVQNPGNNTSFGVWANGVFFGAYNLNNLPLTIQNFPWNGGQNDFLKVCLLNANGDPTNCCAIVEFPVPACLHPNPCDIVNLHVDAGSCTSDSTYEVTIDFDVQNPANTTSFGVWANGEFLGFFNLNDLPLTIQDFPWNGGQNDVVKVCLVVLGTNQTLCCETLEFPVPDCLIDNCHIFDLQVLKTPCLCGQFFAIITFQHSGGGNDGFKIVGNGNNYGNYPYNTVQPIILGPFDGDNMTNYKFAVVDLQNPDCADDFNLGKVDCTMSAVQDPATNGKLTISPNPTSQWLQVNAQINGSSFLGQGDVDIIQPDGRLARTATVANAGQFTLDVSDLPAGLYRLLLKTASGRLEGTFVKN